ncbi:MAG: hypothetical protein J0L65_16835 [Xanthomonadales bacterium]|nr:hypothetical protein [Xanthomonadales bacterium]
MTKNLKTDDAIKSDSASTASPIQKRVASSDMRMLTESELKSLHDSAKAVNAYFKQHFATSDSVQELRALILAIKDQSAK